MPQRSGQKGFLPIVPPHCEAVLLGSYPSPKSFEASFYYGHPRNRFWPLAAALAGLPVPETTEEKKALLLGGRLALWDSLQSCTITGASDASISDPVPNDVAGLLQKTGARVVFCNGTAAHRYYQSFCRQKGGPDALRLPSTSPANAAFSFEKLLSCWRPVRPYLQRG